MFKLHQQKMLVTAQSTKFLASFAMAGFILLDVLMLMMFRYFGVTPMVYLSAEAAVMYVVCTVLLYREYWRTFTVVIYTQVFTYMSLAVYYVGWDAGFQLTIIAMNVLGYYAEYAARTMRVKTLHSLNLSIIGMIVYLGLLTMSRTHVAPYALPDNVSFALRFLWSFILFTIVIAYLQVFINITRNAEDALLDKADHDLLTSLPNRSYMSDYLARLAREKDLGGYWLAMLDIDDFKTVNDTYGHNCGDYVLKTLAQLMRDESDDYEVCRWGGEEFLLVGRTSQSDDPYACLDSLRQTIADQGFWYNEERLGITVTIGVAPYEGKSVAAWVNDADMKLYEGKCSGKNKVMR